MKNTGSVLFLLMTLFIILARGLRNGGGETQSVRKSVKEESGHALEGVPTDTEGGIHISPCSSVTRFRCVRTG